MSVAARQIVQTWLLCALMSACTRTGRTGHPMSQPPGGVSPSGAAAEPTDVSDAAAPPLDEVAEPGGAGAAGQGHRPPMAAPADDAAAPYDDPESAKEPPAEEPDAAVPADPAPRARVGIGETRVLAPLAGRQYTPPADQLNIGFHGTDLGFSVKHQGALYFLFGDTWSTPQGRTIDPFSDDTQAQISLVDFPNGAAVDAWVDAHAAPAGQPPWTAAGPPLRFITDAGAIAPLRLLRDGVQQSLGLGRTPIAAWSNGSDGLFALFLRLQPLPCAVAEPVCPDGFSCDTQLGTVLGVQGEGAVPCVIGEDGGCVPLGGVAGFCQDRSSSAYDTSAAGRRQGVVYQLELANQAQDQPGRYLSQPFNTNKFINPSARTVADFDPSRRDGQGNDYRPPSAPGLNAKVFLWGRPWFVGAGLAQRDARLYFAYLDLPRFSDAGRTELRFHYFSGLSDGVPQFSTIQSDAVALDLSYPGETPWVESWDVTGQISVAYVEPLRKWVMLYGGDLTASPLQFMGQDPDLVRHDPEGAIHLRVADQPWGPWSEPQQLFNATTSSGEVSALPSAPRGVVRRPDCTDSACPPHEPFYPAQERGFLYGANIIQEWTTPRDDGAELYWNVSTWDPYQIVLLKTFLR